MIWKKLEVKENTKWINRFIAPKEVWKYLYFLSLLGGSLTPGFLFGWSLEEYPLPEPSQIQIGLFGVHLLDIYLNNLFISLMLMFLSIYFYDWATKILVVLLGLKIGFFLSPFGSGFGLWYTLVSFPYGLLEIIAYWWSSQIGRGIGRAEFKRKLVLIGGALLLGGVIESLTIETFWKANQ